MYSFIIGVQIKYGGQNSIGVKFSNCYILMVVAMCYNDFEEDASSVYNSSVFRWRSRSWTAAWTPRELTGTPGQIWEAWSMLNSAWALAFICPPSLFFPCQSSSFLSILSINLDRVWKHECRFHKRRGARSGHHSDGGNKKMFVICLSEWAGVLMQGLESCITNVAAERRQRSQTLA